MQNDCTVIVRLTLLNTGLDDVLERVNNVMPVLERQDGYLDSTLLVREGGSEVIQVIRWRERACHDRCQTDPEMVWTVRVSPVTVLVPSQVSRSPSWDDVSVPQERVKGSRHWMSKTNHLIELGHWRCVLQPP